MMMHALALFSLLTAASNSSGGDPVLHTILEHPSPAAFGDFGQFLAFDQDTLVVSHNGVADHTAYVYRRVAGQWVLEQEIDVFPASPGLGASSVALHDDLLVIGFAFPSNDGKAFVYRRSGSTWSLEETLSPPIAPFALHFGTGVAVDGHRIAVGAHGDPDTFEYAPGLVHVFEHSGSSWELSGSIARKGVGSCNMGRQISLSGDTLAASVGGMGIVCPALGTQLFRLAGGTWLEDGSLPFNNVFAQSIALRSDVIIQGSQVFRRTISGWQLEADLVPGPGASIEFGQGGVGFDGMRAAIGDTGADGGLGAVYVYEAVAPGTWALANKLVPSLGQPQEEFGKRVALQGRDIVVSAPLAEVGGIATAGEVDLFSFPVAPNTFCPPSGATSCGGNLTYTGTPSITGGGFTISASNVDTSTSGVLVYGFDRALIPMNSGFALLCVAPPAARVGFQGSGGTPPTFCDGTLSFDFLAHVLAGTDPALFPGNYVTAQWWYRTPSVSFSPFSFSSALEFSLCP